jgi:hypothetical protein
MATDRRIDRALSKLWFHDRVPDEVATRFEDVKCVLDMARENERMLRVAVEYATNTLELSVRLLCDRLGFEEAMERDSDQTLPNLFEWLHRRDYLPHRPVEEPEDQPHSETELSEEGLPIKYEALGDLRNSWLHAHSESWLGWHFLRVIPRYARLINRLYDGPKRRRREREKRRTAICHCRRLTEEGVALEYGNGRILLHLVSILHCDLKREEAYYFGMWPLYEVNPEAGETVEGHVPYLAKCTSVSVTEEGSLMLETRRETPLLLDRTLDRSEREELEDWKSEAKSGTWIGFNMYSPASLRTLLFRPNSSSALVRVDDLRWID